MEQARAPTLELKDYALKTLGRDFSLLETSSPVAESFRASSSSSVGSPRTAEANGAGTTASLGRKRQDELPPEVDDFAEAAQLPLLQRISSLERIVSEKDREIEGLKAQVAELLAKAETHQDESGDG